MRTVEIEKLMLLWIGWIIAGVVFGIIMREDTSTIVFSLCLGSIFTFFWGKKVR